LFRIANGDVSSLNAGSTGTGSARTGLSQLRNLVPDAIR